MEPSKSGVLGLICAALGRDRSESLDDLASLRMGVRVDREGGPADGTFRRPAEVRCPAGGAMASPSLTARRPGP